MELLGKNLEILLQHLPGKRMTVKTVLMLATQMIDLLKYIHQKNYIHRDVKPDNFVIGKGNEGKTLYLIDFGLAKLYRNPKTLKINPLIVRKKLTGTARYASIHALEGFEQSPRDDIESVGYVIIYLIKGFLPWQGLILKTKEDKYAKILEKKKKISSQEICSCMPKEIETFLDYTKDLRYEEIPDYEYIKDLFQSALQKMGEMNDSVYDWMTMMNTTSSAIANNYMKRERNSMNNYMLKNNKMRVEEILSPMRNTNKTIFNNYVTNQTNTVFLNKYDQSKDHISNYNSFFGEKRNSFIRHFNSSKSYRKKCSAGTSFTKSRKPTKEKDEKEEKKKQHKKSSGCITKCCFIF